MAKEFWLRYKEISSSSGAQESRFDLRKYMHSELRIQCCCIYGVGSSCSSDLIPGPGIPNARGRQKKKKKKKKQKRKRKKKSQLNVIKLKRRNPENDIFIAMKQYSFVIMFSCFCIITENLNSARGIMLTPLLLFCQGRDSNQNHVLGTIPNDLGQLHHFILRGAIRLSHISKITELTKWKWQNSKPGLPDYKSYVLSTTSSRQKENQSRWNLKLSRSFLSRGSVVNEPD